MAKQGKNGTFTGKMGNLVGSTWNGIPYVKKRPQWRGRYKPTEKQLLNQAKFRFAMKQMREFRELLNLTVEFETGQSSSSSAMRTLLNEAIVGVHPDLALDYSRLLLAKGTLLPEANVHVESTEAGILKYTWTDEVSKSDHSRFGPDHAMMIACWAEGPETWYELNGARRWKLSAEMKLPEFFSGKTLHTWLAFRSPDFKLKSNSVYTGTIAVL